MRASLFHEDPLSAKAPLLAFAVFEHEELSPEAAQADAAVGGAFSSAREAGDFRGHEEEFALFYAAGTEGGQGPSRIVFIGAGERSKADGDSLRRFAARAVRRAESLYLTRLALHVRTDVLDAVEEAVRVSAEGVALAAWDFRELKTGADSDEEEEPKPLVAEAVLAVRGDPEACVRAQRLGSAFASGEMLARDLQWRPGNVATPSHLAEVALGLAETYGFDSTILGPKELVEERMHALLAVSAGSEEEPRLIVLEHHGGEEDVPPVALVGKGLTFDAGGISIKPAQGMEEMKYDMSGGAAVLGAMRAIGELGLPVNVVGVVPSSENLISGKATKPGDVIRTRQGKTVEVVNTDAEGRLILADALAYTVDNYSPSAIVDLATLTGACVIALGHHAAAVLGSDEGLISELREAGDRAAERCWPLPLWDPYRKQLESTVADLKNVGGRPAGTITAAWFLSEFVGGVKWAHLDIAGTAYGDPTAPYQRKGGFGFPTRLLLEWVLGRAG